MIFKAADYDFRQDLVKYINAQIGIDIKENREAGHIIKGTRKKLEKLYLDDTNRVYGVKVVITDKPTSDKIKTETEERRKKPKPN